jgi:dihydroorotate dehydrogenase (NAD+) catalytic subunit
MSLQNKVVGTEPGRGSSGPGSSKAGSIERQQVDFGVDLAPHNKFHLRISNPVMIASGTFGYDGYGRGITSEMDLGRLGAVIPKTFTRLPKQGNPEPRWDPPSYRQGMEEGDFLFLNSIGLANPGIDAALSGLTEEWSRYHTTVVLSISGDSVSQFAEMTFMAQSATGFQAIELNLSCPNVENGAMFGHSAQLAAAAVEAVKKNTELPVLAKLAPNVPDITEIARAAVDSGADALTICNTVPAMAIDIEARKPVLGGITGGISGHALRLISLALVYRTAQVVNVPIIGVGGIFEAKHILEYLMAGATAIQVGSANLVNLWSPFNIVDELKERLATAGICRLDQVIGAALKN